MIEYRELIGPNQMNVGCPKWEMHSNYDGAKKMSCLEEIAIWVAWMPGVSFCILVFSKNGKTKRNLAATKPMFICLHHCKGLFKGIFTVIAFNRESNDESIAFVYTFTFVFKTVQME